MSKAVRWSKISLVDRESTDTVVHVESDKVSLLMQPRTLGTWFVFAQDPDGDGADAQLSVIEAHTQANPEGTAFIRFKSMSGEDHLLVRPDGHG